MNTLKILYNYNFFMAVLNWFHVGKFKLRGAVRGTLRTIFSRDLYLGLFLDQPYRNSRNFVAIAGLSIPILLNRYLFLFKQKCAPLTVYNIINLRKNLDFTINFK